MITLKVEYFLNKEGINYFPEWFEELTKVISNHGFHSVRYETKNEQPIIYLLFKNQNTLDVWSETDSHDELFSKIENYFLIDPSSLSINSE